MAALPVTPMPAPQPDAPRLSESERILDTFIAPSKTFTDLRRNSSWWAPWLLISIFWLLFVLSWRKQIGFEQISKNSIAQSSRAEQFDKLPADQQAKQVQLATTITRYISYSLPVIQLITFLVIAAVLMATFNFGAGASVPFKTSVAIVIYGSLPSIIGAALGIVSMFAGVDPAGFNAQNPVATNPAHFMDPTGNKFFYGMASRPGCFHHLEHRADGHWFRLQQQSEALDRNRHRRRMLLLYKLVGAGMAAAF